MKEEEIDIFEKTLNQLEGLHTEVSTLSKKSYTDALNDFKLKLVNQVLLSCNDILGKKYKPFDDFDSFDTEQLPSNSDVTLVLSQYLNCIILKLNGHLVAESLKSIGIGGNQKIEKHIHQKT